MARTIDEETRYRVKIHRNAGRNYASTQPIVVDPDRTSGRNRHKRIHWGTVDENGKFHPNKTFLTTPLEERRKLQFPEDWDMSEVEALQGGHCDGSPSGIFPEGTDMLYGDVWLMERVAEATEIRDDLQEVLGYDNGMADAVLTMAMFQISTGYSMDRIEAWQRVEKTPSPVLLTESAVTRITLDITEQDRLTLCRFRAARNDGEDLIATEFTTPCSLNDQTGAIFPEPESDNIPSSRDAHVIVYDTATQAPVHYRTYPYNINGSRMAGAILDDLKASRLEGLTLVTDRGYGSLLGLERLILDGQPLVMPVSEEQPFVTARIGQLAPYSHHPAEMEHDEELGIYSRQYDLDYGADVREGADSKGVGLKLDLYFDPERRSAMLERLDLLTTEQDGELRQIMDMGVGTDEDIREQYPFHDITLGGEDRRVISYGIRESEVEGARQRAGFFAIVTCATQATATEAIRKFHPDSSLTKYFARGCWPMERGHMPLSPRDGRTGRGLITFVAMTLDARIRHVAGTALKGRYGSARELLDEMRSIRAVERPGRDLRMTPFDDSQIEICRAFGIGVPPECM